MALMEEDGSSAIGENQPYAIAEAEGPRFWFEKLAKALSRIQEGL